MSRSQRRWRRKKSRGIWWVLRLPTRHFSSWGRAGIGFLTLLLYGYIVLTQPLIEDMIPPISPVGSPLPRLGASWLDGVIPVMTAGSEQESVCVVPVTISGPPVDRLHGTVMEADLPWTDVMPERLVQLRSAHGADRLVSAYRTTLPNPLWDEAHNVAVAARYIQGTVVAPGETISLIKIIGPFTEERGYKDGPTYVGGRIMPTLAGGVCKIATTLYNAVVYADLKVVERKPHSMVVPYVPPGRDAAIATGHKDLRFQNDQDAPIVIWAQMEGSTLYVALYGRYDPPTVQWEHEELSRQKTWVIRRPADDLRKGEERVVIEGHDGVTVKTGIVVTYPGREPIRKEPYIDTYLPLPESIEYGSN